MKVRIGIADTNKVIELEVDEPAEFESMVEESYSSDSSLLWFEDEKQRRIGIPRERLGYVEIETDGGRRSVGFGP